MSLASDAAALSVDRLRPAHLADALMWLEHEPVLHVYLTALTLRDALGSPHDHARLHPKRETRRTGARRCPRSRPSHGRKRGRDREGWH